MIKKGQLGKSNVKKDNPLYHFLKPFDNKEITALDDQPKDSNYFYVVFKETDKIGYMPADIIEWDTASQAT